MLTNKTSCGNLMHKVTVYRGQRNMGGPTKLVVVYVYDRRERVEWNELTPAQ